MAMTARSIKVRSQKSEVRILSLIGLLAMCCFARAQDASTLLSAPKLPPYKWFASTDPKHQNADYVLLKPGETRRIPLAAGVLLRLWSTAFEPQNLRLVLQNGNQQTELLNGGKAKFGELYEKAFTFYPTPSTPAVVRELKSNAVLIATNKSKAENKWYYQAAVRPVQNPPASVLKNVNATLPGELHHQDLADAASELWRNWFDDKRTIEIPAKQKTVFWSTNGAGCISEIKITPTASTPGIERALKLQLQIEGKQAISLPLNQISIEGKSYTFGFLVPFAKGARIELVNESSESLKLQTHITSHPLSSDYRLHSIPGSARSQKGKPIPILKVQGEGAFVGLVLDIRPAPDAFRHTFAFLEGNETLIADGKKYEGTGTEDFFNSAWYYPEKSFSKQYHGMSFKSTSPPRVTAYRWMIPDAVPFQKNFEFDFEHGNGNNSDDLEFRWVAFWYQKHNAKFEIADALNSAASGQSSTPVATGATSGNNGELLILVVLGAAVGVGALLLIRRKRAA